MTRCEATAADPSTPNRLMRCESPVADHQGAHHGHGLNDGRVHLWGAQAADARRTPPPDDDLWRAYQSGDQLQIAAARGRYSQKLIDHGLPGLNDGLPIEPSER